ncbi:hypothetical protein PLCT1_01639 [Planctomycetaceae bacterium]|nr:hypothetical protein PLCT1_01639 [Planctomycetaceae bacterium]
MKAALILAALCLAATLQAGAVLTTEMPSGSWEIVPAAKLEAYEGPACFNEEWKPLKRTSADPLITWFLPTAHKDHGRPLSIFILSGEDNGWQRDSEKARLWLSGKGEGQRPYVVVCAPDVTQLLDPNRDEYSLWLAVEYADGARLPFYGTGFPRTHTLGAKPYPNIEPWAIQLPVDYKQSEPTSRQGNAPVSLKQGQGRIVARDKAPEFKGRAWAWHKWLGVEKGETAALISWAPAPAQPEDGRPVKYFLFFGKLEAPVFNDNPNRVAQWLSGKGDGQWELYVECAADVTQVLDLNKDKYRVFLAVEFESGKRVGYQGLDCPRVDVYSEAMMSRVSRNAFRVPTNYGRPAPVEMIDIRERVQVYLKEGRSWTTKNVSKVINAGENTNFTRVEILKVGENEVEYRVTELGADGQPLAGVEPAKLKLALKVPKPKEAKSDPLPILETITVKAGTFECLRTESEYSGTKSVTWTSKKYPGLVVKQTSLGDTIESSQELVEFKE